MSMNMSYCRFENTYKAFTECVDALNDGDELSRSEQRYAKNLFNDTLEILFDLGILDEDECNRRNIFDRLDEWVSGIKANDGEEE